MINFTLTISNYFHYLHTLKKIVKMNYCISTYLSAMAVLSEIEAIAASVENDGIMQPSEIDIIAASVDKNDVQNDQDGEEQELFPNDEPKEPGDSSNPNEIDQSESNPDGSHFEIINPVPYKVPNDTST